MFNATQLTQEQIQKLSATKYNASGFDIFLSGVPSDPKEVADLITRVGKWASNYQGLGFGGKPTVTLAAPGSADHPSPVHSNAFAVTYKWNKTVSMNGPEALERLRYIFEGYDGYDGAEFYTDINVLEIVK